MDGGKGKQEKEHGVDAVPKYEVQPDLKSLFYQSDAKPFTFLDADEQDDLPYIPPRKSDSDDEYEEDDLPPVTFTAPVSQQKHSFFFRENDPRLAEGMAYLNLTEEQKAASIATWKVIRPQLFADFKKIKKQANRKRKRFTR